MQDCPGAGVFRTLSRKRLVGLGKVETRLPVLPSRPQSASGRIWAEA